MLGAGLQGTCIAFELAGQGARVDLYERKDTCLAEASLYNTGKLHLGLVYGRDRSFATARLLAEGALRFEPLLTRWVGRKALSHLVTSSPDLYVVHRDGLLGPEEFEFYSKEVTALMSNVAKAGDQSYFGQDVGRPLKRLTKAERTTLFRPETTGMAYQSQEISIDPESLAGIMRKALSAAPEIRFLTRRRVVSVNYQCSSLVVTSILDGTADSEGYDFVINALWAGRLAIDQQLGVLPRARWCYRFRYFLRASRADAILIPSTTIVQGPFGEVANFKNGLLCLSWYPAGLRAWSTDVEPPELPPLLSGAPAIKIKNATCEGLSSVICGMAEIELDNVEVRGGWIFAFGETDIDDPDSQLHRRTAVGVERKGRYLTVNTGKLTLAPLFAERVVGLLSE